MNATFKALFAAGLLSITVSAPTYADGGVNSTVCKDYTMRIGAETGAKFDRYSGHFDNVFFSHPLSEIVLSCANPSEPSVSLEYNGTHAPNSWFALSGKLGAIITGAAAKKIEAAVKACNRNALKGTGEFADAEMEKATITCQAFTRDGGGGSAVINFKE